MKPSLLAHYLGGLNRRSTGPSRWRGVGEILAFILGGFLFAALLYFTALGCLLLASLLTSTIP